MKKIYLITGILYLLSLLLPFYFTRQEDSLRLVYKNGYIYILNYWEAFLVTILLIFISLRIKDNVNYIFRILSLISFVYFYAIIPISDWNSAFLLDFKLMGIGYSISFVFGAVTIFLITFGKKGGRAIVEQ
ncbi:MULTISPECIES: hypothetical protein [unclassified Lactococcus]|uniref:hypothetical protein n=1 Tax=unclassified Lactococcus TaxID=2643510 RepID=UPI0011C96C57|nr:MULTISPECIES: hypothetical protein [unclassified Lactococcus]MQW24092.1 hypothetical protein [Lactococcus sp. dk101]TXK36574.1 hypothetical protein FVP42_11130 [Lactococcus sp. dk310]TXK36580.1 hypothetical protein FVP42_11160 [Lactococcus sp. dk310]TXK46409.1 hypothetical protein FVP43_11015 [Lactococcus sp. dk322]TXK46415.1 hypothetical protein FVP43_11045 [Lactococcus sp. dk322]